MLCSEEFELLPLRETIIDQVAGDRCGLGKAHSSSDTMKNTCLCVHMSTIKMQKPQSGDWQDKHQMARASTKNQRKNDFKGLNISNLEPSFTILVLH